MFISASCVGTCVGPRYALCPQTHPQDYSPEHIAARTKMAMIAAIGATEDSRERPGRNLADADALLCCNRWRSKRSAAVLATRVAREQL
jgi:hypothetical protein